MLVKLNFTDIGRSVPKNKGNVLQRCGELESGAWHKRQGDAAHY